MTRLRNGKSSTTTTTGAAPSTGLSASASPITSLRMSTRSRARGENALPTPTPADKEKENTGRATHRTRTHHRRGLLGTGEYVATTTTTTTQRLDPSRRTIRTKEPPLGKGTRTVMKMKPVPLQDVTVQFAPTSEAQNRGGEYADPDVEEEEGRVEAAMAPPPPPPNADEAEAPTTMTAAGPRADRSPLPPSSPPSDLDVPLGSAARGTHRRESLAMDVATTLFPVPEGPTSRACAYDTLHDLDLGHVDFQTLDADADAEEHSNFDFMERASDPYGFLAAERQLKALSPSKNGGEPGIDFFGVDEDLLDIPVAESSSPRPVPRRNRLHHGEEEEEEEEEDIITEAPAPAQGAAHPHFTTPPTPHKQKRRLSLDDAPSPDPSSFGSSPSPTKASAKKRAHAHVEDTAPGYAVHDPLDEFNEEMDRTEDQEGIGAALVGVRMRAVKRRRASPDADAEAEVGARARDEKVEEDDSVVAHHLRPRKSLRAPSEEEREKEGRAVKARPRRSRTAAAASPAKKERVHVDKAHESDDEEMIEQARQERIEYFKQLDEYEVETEDVYVI